jgi:RNA polymerase sigma-70 factor (ECF subfamily)
MAIPITPGVRLNWSETILFPEPRRWIIDRGIPRDPRVVRLPTMTKELDDRQLSELRHRIQSAVRRVCPGWLRGDVEDVTQNALLKVVEVLQRRGDRNPGLAPSYLWRVAYTSTVDAIRSRRESRQREVAMEETTGPRAQPAPDPDPERRSAGSEIGRGIEECLERLVRPRKLAAMLYLQGHTAPEIGRLMHWTPAKSNNLVHRGIADLRRCLEGKGLSP